MFILVSIAVFLILILLIVILLLVAKKYLSPSGNVNITINGDRTISVGQGASLMTTLNENGIFLPSACGFVRTVQGAGARRRRRNPRL